MFTILRIFLILIKSLQKLLSTFPGRFVRKAQYSFNLVLKFGFY